MPCLGARRPIAGRFFAIPEIQTKTELKFPILQVKSRSALYAAPDVPPSTRNPGQQVSGKGNTPTASIATKRRWLPGAPIEVPALAPRPRPGGGQRADLMCP